MAYLKQIFDSSLKGGVDKRGLIKKFVGSEALNNSIVMFLLSYRGEVIDAPNFGGVLLDYLNKPLDDMTARDLESAITSSLESMFTPRLVVTSLKVVPNYNQQLYEIQVEGYSPEINNVFKIDEKFKVLN